MNDPVNQASQTIELLGGDARLEVRDAYLFVWHARAAHNVAELDDLLNRIDDELARQACGAIMFDSRDASYEEGAVQARMWDWLDGHELLTRVATLVQSPRLAVSVQLTGMSRRVKIKAFADEHEAEAWLTQR